MQNETAPSAGERILDALGSVGWFDWTAIAVIAVFLVLGLFRGAAWQVSRLAILVVSYAVALAFGGGLASVLEGWFGTSTDPELYHHIAHSALFLTVLIAVGVVFWLLQRFSEKRELTPANRVAGAFVGTLSGALLVLALVTGMHMFLGEGGIARAAEGSTSATVGRRALELAESVLPEQLASGARHWRQILRDPGVPAPAGEAGAAPGAEAVEGDFKKVDPVQVQEAPADRGR